MSQSPELAGGEGFTFEGTAAAYYLSSLLAEAYAPGIDNKTVVQVSVQQRDFGEPLDDVIVDFEDIAKNSSRLSLQIKRSLTISQAKTNKDFRDIIRDSWATFNKPNFRINNDRYGAAVGTITATKERVLKTLCDWARESLTTDHFDTRFSISGIASADLRTIKNDIVALLEEVKGASCTNTEVHQFLAHFVLIQFDFLREGATDHTDAINRIQSRLTSSDAKKAPLVWSHIVQLARASAGKAGQFTRSQLVNLITPIAHLQGATSLRQDLDQLTILAKNYSDLIQDDIGGTKLNRNTLIEELHIKLTKARLVQIRGLPGSGKSALIKHTVQHALEHGTVLFLKAEQLEGTSWISYANAQGLSSVPLEQLLVEIGATGTPIFFIDAIDRIEKERQPIILDVINTIVNSTLLTNWRVVVSLRDTGIEILRNWLGHFIDTVTVETLNTDQLNDEEAEMLANAKPHLRPLLFGTSQIQEIVRRPFFAKVLNQSYVADPSIPTFIPQSEVDLIENWWKHGGYNESGQDAIERQQVLLKLASIHARDLSRPIRLSMLANVAHIDDLRADSILQNARHGISFRFAHDIFFEWAFFHVLADKEEQWVDEIKACGEPPAVARVVELLSQWEYTCGNNWATYLAKTQKSNLRSQWLRAWLIGPIGTAKFEADENQFTKIVFADDFQLFSKMLVWFQAEKTSPNANILAGSLPHEKRQQFAYLLGWPSDFASWHRLIDFILRYISDIPQRLYPEIVAIFEVWQNALSDLRNPTSNALLLQCATWLTAIDRIGISNGPDENSVYWKNVLNLGEFRKSLEGLLLRSARAEPTFSADYLQRIINSKSIHEKEFNNIIGYSPFLAKSLPKLLVDLSLIHFCKELPDDTAIRLKKESRDAAKMRRTIQAKPEKERTQLEKMTLASFPSHFFRGFDRHDWERLSIYDNFSSAWPPSPLREPFHSLFQVSPNEALRLLRNLSNHAITAWHQLHRHAYEREGSPIPLELIFPWGNQKFWGTDREYLWFRSMFTPKIIGCGFMALEEWCFAELKNDRAVDELIQQILAENECIAILGAAIMLLLHTESVSEVTLPLVTSQCLLMADQNRMMQDLSSNSNLIGFTRHDDSHFEAVQAANKRSVRKKELKWLIPKFVFGAKPISDHARNAILNFKNDLPFQYVEHRSIPEIQEELTIQAVKYAELVEEKNYQAYHTEENSDQIAIVHVSPSAAEPENVARAEEATKWLHYNSLWVWASKSFEDKVLCNTHSIDNAITLAKEADSNDLFEYLQDNSGEELLSQYQSAVIATAAIVLNFREGCTLEDLEWALNVIKRASKLPSIAASTYSSSSIIPWHPLIYVAHGLGANIREDTVMPDIVFSLLNLISEPLEIVSITAFEEACSLWTKDPKLTWTALILALSFCHYPSRSSHQVDKRGEMLNTAISFYEKGNGWSTLPLPPPAWVKVQPNRNRREYWDEEDYGDSDLINTDESWGEPDVFWDSKQAAKILKRIPFEALLNSSARSIFLEFLASVLDWTNQKNSPHWVKPGHRNHSSTRNLEWTYELGSSLGKVAGLIPLDEFQAPFLDRILELEGDNCWHILSSFTDTYICAYVYDASVVPIDATTILILCLERLLQAPVFNRGTYRSGDLSGFDLPRLVQTLMFVSVERADLSARYVNGDWSEIDRILPLINRFVRAAGWASSIMNPFLTLCERAKANYPAEVFADQVLSIIGNDSDNDLKGWHGTIIPARIAELVHYFAHRDAPMGIVLAQKLLQILDILVDMGDRRSAALQLSEVFREVRLSYS